MQAEWSSPDGTHTQVIEGATEAELNQQADRLDKVWVAGRPSAPYIGEAQPSTTREKGRAFAQGGTLGFQDEIQAALGATMDVLGGNEPVENWVKAYRNQRDDERVAQDVYALSHPKENFALQMAGGMALPGGAAMKAASEGAKWGTLARVGGSYGVLAGLGNAEGPPVNQAASAVGGGILGATTGMAVPFGSQLATEGIKQAGRAVAPVLSQAATRMGNFQNAYRALPQGALTGPERVRLAQRAEELGIHLTPGEQHNSIPMRQAEAAMRSSPISPIGWHLNSVRQSNLAVLDNLTAETIGAPQVSEVSAPLVAKRAKELGSLFDRIENNLGTMRIDNQARQELNQLMGTVSNPLAPNKTGMAVIRRFQGAQEFRQPIQGPVFRQLRSNFQDASSAAWNKGDAQMGKFYDGMVDMMEGVVDRQVVRNSGRFTSQQRLPEIWAGARAQWQVVKALRRPGVIHDGHVVPGRLASALNDMDKAGFRDMGRVGGNDPKSKLYDALRVNEYFGDVTKDSGTATRSAYNGLAGEGILKMAARAGTAAALRPLGRGYMRFGTEGMVGPGNVAAGVMDPLVGGLSAGQSAYGGFAGRDENADE